jgi:hypothetical protein
VIKHNSYAHENQTFARNRSIFGLSGLNAKLVIVVTVTTTVAVIIASVTKQLGSWLGWFRDADRLAIVSGLSQTNLLLVSILSLGIAFRRLRRHDDKARDWFVWLLISVGTLFLFADSALGVNEWIETKFERILGISDTRWTRRIDDGLIAIGGMIGIGAICYWRTAFSETRESALLFGTAVVLLSAMMLLDLTTDQLDLLMPDFGQTEFTKRTRGAIELLEDTLMLIGEALLVIGTFIAFQASGRRS